MSFVPSIDITLLKWPGFTFCGRGGSPTRLERNARPERDPGFRRETQRVEHLLLTQRPDAEVTGMARESERDCLREARVDLSLRQRHREGGRGDLYVV